MCTENVGSPIQSNIRLQKWKTNQYLLGTEAVTVKAPTDATLHSAMKRGNKFQKK